MRNFPWKKTVFVPFYQKKKFFFKQNRLLVSKSIKNKSETYILVSWPAKEVKIGDRLT